MFFCFIMAMVCEKPKKSEFSLPSHLLHWSSIFINRAEFPEIIKPVNFQMSKWTIARKLCCENYAEIVILMEIR